MKDYARNLDELRRIVIPIEILRLNNIGAGDLMSIKVVPEGILLTPAKSSCEICGAKENLTVLNDQALCGECISKFASAEYASVTSSRK
jgi:bifunctional DNA-binding transcriptional regulator/antitoxin component of YhaV-PrlF toxin-antitoxin module